MPMGRKCTGYFRKIGFGEFEPGDRAFSPCLCLCRLDETWVKTLERGCVHSIGCWTGCPVRSLRIVRFSGVICTRSPRVEEEQSQAWQTLSKTFLGARKEIYNPHPGKQVGSLDSARNPARASLTGGSPTPPAYRSSPHLKGFLSPGRSGNYCLSSALLFLQEMHDC